MITNQQLRDSFLTPPMKHYFDRKLAPLTSDEVDTRIEELLKYLNMAEHCHGGIPFSDEIDDAWHLWIMQTKEYASLCRKLQGGRFIHHSSNDYEDFEDPQLRERPVDLNRAVGLLASYVLNYGPFEASRLKYWPLAAQVTERLGWSAERLNDWLVSATANAARRAGSETAEPESRALEAA